MTPSPNSLHTELRWRGLLHQETEGCEAHLAKGLVTGYCGFDPTAESLHVGKSIDGLVMVLLGGLQTLVGPVVGALTFTWLHDTVAGNTDYWRAMLGAIILLLVLLFPQGIAGFARQLINRRQSAAEREAQS